MKLRKFFTFLLVVVLLIPLAGCAGVPETDYVAQLAYPGTEWCMTPEQVIENLGLSKSNYTRKDTEKACTIRVTKSLSLFGGKTKEIQFRFVMGAGGNYALHMVQVLFPEQANMEAIFQNMTATYGECLSGDQLPVRPSNAPSDYFDHVRTWESSKTRRDMLTDEEFTAYRDVIRAAYIQSPNETDEQFEARVDAALAEYDRDLSENSAASIKWSDNFYLAAYIDLGNNDSYGTPNGLIFRAPYVSVLQEARKHLDAQ